MKHYYIFRVLTIQPSMDQTPNPRNYVVAPLIIHFNAVSLVCYIYVVDILSNIIITYNTPYYSNMV